MVRNSGLCLHLRRGKIMKKTAFVCFQALLTFLWLAGCGLASDQELLEGIKQSRTGQQPHPLPSSKLPDLNEEKAYTLQKLLAEELVSSGLPISGYKAGLTTAASQKRFKAKSPVLGPLFKPGELGPDAVVNSKDYVRLIIEMEIGYIA